MSCCSDAVHASPLPRRRARLDAMNTHFRRKGVDAQHRGDDIPVLCSCPSKGFQHDVPVSFRAPLARRSNPHARHFGAGRNPLPLRLRRGSPRSGGGMTLLAGFRSPVGDRDVLVSTSLSFSDRLPGGRVTSLCLAKEKSPRERPPREHVLSTSLCSGYASGRRGSPKGHPWPCGELARILRAILRTDPASTRRVRGAPLGALPARIRGQSKLFALASNEVTMAVIEAELFRGPCTAVRAGRSGPQGGRKGLRPLAAAPRRARRQARPDRTDFSSMDGRKTQHRGGLSLGDFSLAMQREVTRVRGTHTERDMDVMVSCAKCRAP